MIGPEYDGTYQWIRLLDENSASFGLILPRDEFPDRFQFNNCSNGINSLTRCMWSVIDPRDMTKEQIAEMTFSPMEP